MPILDPLSFDLAERTHPAELLRRVGLCLQSPVLQAVLASLQGYALVLDGHRQAVAANPALLAELGLEVYTVQGKRPGEILGCAHVPEGIGGCGTGEACSQCGALLAILASQVDGNPVAGECWMTLNRGKGHQAREFACRATRLEAGGVPFTIFVLQDISGEKRREVLERLFLHDLNNALQGLHTWSDLLDHPEVDPAKAASRIRAISGRLQQEVTYQRLLLDAEHGRLEPQFEDLDPRSLLTELSAYFHGHPKAEGKLLRLECPGEPPRLRSDPTLLLRILTNGVLNALEASGPGSEIKVTCTAEGGRPTFVIANPGAIPLPHQTRIFQRSFSTKAAKGRGLGTYSMKLLAEDYLGGRLTLASDPIGGTRFILSLPPP